MLSGETDMNVVFLVSLAGSVEKRSRVPAASGKIHCDGMQYSLMVQSSYTPHTLKEMLGWIETHLYIDTCI